MSSPPLPQSPSLFLSKIRYAELFCLSVRLSVYQGSGSDVSQSSILEGSGPWGTWPSLLLISSFLTSGLPHVFSTVPDARLPQDLCSGCYRFLEHSSLSLTSPLSHTCNSFDPLVAFAVTSFGSANPLPHSPHPSLPYCLSNFSFFFCFSLLPVIWVIVRSLGVCLFIDET